MTALLAARVVVGVHLGFLVFLALGSLAAWRRPSLIWFHLPCVGWAFLSVVVRVDCPLTVLEKDLLRAGGVTAYRGGFIDHYLEGRLYPAAWAPVAAAAVAALVAIGYAGVRSRSAQLVSEP